MKITGVVVPVNDKSACDREFYRRVINQRVQLGHGLEVRMPRQPDILSYGDQLPCPLCSLGSSGTSRAPRPKRKMVAAMRPTEMPHSKMVGLYVSGAI